MRWMLTALSLPLACCGSAPPPPTQVGDGWLPSGPVTANVQQVTDACALLLSEFKEGGTIGVYFQLSANGDGVEVIFPGTNLPSLSAAMHQKDVFRTDPYNTTLTANDGLCRAQRTQYEEGMAPSDSEYRLRFHSLDTMPVGDCGATPIPCETVVTMSLPFCSPNKCPPAAVQ